MAAMTQMTPPMEITPIMLSWVAPDTALSTSADTSRVAMAIPDTGLLEEPTNPTRREDTAANRKPNTAISRAPTKLTGTAGTSHMITTAMRTPMSTTFIGISLSVRRVET